MNLITQISELLQQIPLKTRKWVYRLGAIAATLYGLWEASNHDWKTFAASLAAAFAGAMASANAKPVDEVDGSEPDEENINPVTFAEDAPAPAPGE